MLAISLTAVLVFSSIHSVQVTAPPATAAATLIPETAPGRCAGRWLELLRSGNADDVRAFETTYRAPKRLAERSLDERVAGFPAIRADFAGLVVREILQSTDTRLALLADSAGGPTRLDFVLDDAGKLDSIQIARGDDVGARPIAIDAARRESLVLRAAKAMREDYVFPEKGEAMASAISAALSSGAYSGILDERELCDRLTKDMRAVTNDRHLRVLPVTIEAEQQREEGIGPSAEDARRENWSFKRCEIVDGNIGVLRFDAFSPTDEAKRVADAAMAFLGRCDALVFDLRANGGGSPEMINYLSGYLFESPVLLNRMVARDGSVSAEAFSEEDVNGSRFPNDLPIYVVTSSRTFSGAEEFTYNLKNLGRATVVGETTGGGAHPIRPVRLDDGVIILMPFMRAENPVTRANWEGTGVEPHVKVRADEALDRAIELARKKLGRG